MHPREHPIAVRQPARGFHPGTPSRRRRPARMLDPMLLSAYDAVLFDLDGVLSPTAGIHAACWKATFDSFLAELPASGRSTCVATT